MTRVLLACTLAAAAWLAGGSASAQRLSRPFSCGGCISNYFYYDHAGGSGVDDWNCRGSTYNGHGGSDFSLSGGLASIDGGYNVRAAADGVVIDVNDGGYDHCSISSISECDSGTRCTYGTANYVVIRHENRTTRYVHLRRGSVRVADGERVTCGQVIGQIGSSGCSTNAHLHFEVRPRTDAYASRYDPFMGACSPRTSSLWIGQGGYRGYPSSSCPTVEPPPPPPPADAGPAPMPDAGPVAELDAGPTDAGATSEDAGDVEADAGSMTEGDAGDPDVDAGRRRADAGHAADAGTRSSPHVEGSCSCRTPGTSARSGTAAPIALGLTALAAVRVARSRRRR